MEGGGGGGEKNRVQIDLEEVCHVLGFDSPIEV